MAQVALPPESPPPSSPHSFFSYLGFPSCPVTERLLRWSLALGRLGCTRVRASTASRATLHLSELPAGQHHPTCQPWALSVCLQVLLSASGFKEGSSALLIPGTASGMYHHSLCQQGFLWMSCLLCSSWAGCWAGQAGELRASRRETSVGDSGRIQPC